MASRGWYASFSKWLPLCLQEVTMIILPQHFHGLSSVFWGGYLWYAGICEPDKVPL